MVKAKVVLENVGVGKMVLKHELHESIPMHVQ
jgi:hypothetical protein